MATPALAALRARPDVSHLAVACRPYVAPVFEAAPFVDEIISWDAPGAADGAGLLKTARKLCRNQYDIIVLLTNSFKSALLARLAAIPRRIGFARDWRRFLLTDPLAAPRTGRRYQPRPMLEYYWKLVQPLGVDEMPIRMQLFTRPQDDAAAADLYRKLGLEGEKTLILAPGAAFGAAKCWPAERFAAVARRARDELGLTGLLLCSGKERPVAERIADESTGAALLPEGSLPLATVKALVRAARAMVTNDSGLRHFAAAFELPVVTIFGPTHIEWTETWFAREKKLQAAVDCGPCQRKICPLGHLECMQKVTVEEVMTSLAELLQSSGG